MNKFDTLIDSVVKALNVYIENNKKEDVKTKEETVTLTLSKHAYNELLQIADIDISVQYHISDKYFNCDHFGCCHCKNRGACYFTTTMRTILGLPVSQKEYDKFKEENPDKVATY